MGAIFAGAAAAASLALMLLMLGAGLGLTSISPWENQGLAAGTVGIAAIAWLTFTQIVASGMGGYLAGRLRTKWVDTHTNEIYFRDTAHGFLTWAVALLVSAVLLTTTISSLIGGSAKVIGSVAGGATATAMNNAGTEPLCYRSHRWNILPIHCSGLPLPLRRIIAGCQQIHQAMTLWQ